MEITSQGNMDFLTQVSKTQQAKKKKIKTKLENMQNMQVN